MKKKSLLTTMSSNDIGLLYNLFLCSSIEKVNSILKDGADIAIVGYRE